LATPAFPIFVSFVYFVDQNLGVRFLP
jgi:hypothetical protein